MNYENYYGREEIMRLANISLGTFYTYLKKGIIKAPKLKKDNRLFCFTIKEKDKVLRDIKKWKNKRKDRKHRKMQKQLRKKLQMQQKREMQFQSLREQMQCISINETMDKYIVLLRKQGLRQWEIAEILNTSQPTVSRVLNGKRLRSGMEIGKRYKAPLV